MPRQAYTIEFKELAVKRSNGGQSVSMVEGSRLLARRSFRENTYISRDADFELLPSKHNGRLVNSVEAFFRMRAFSRSPTLWAYRKSNRVNS